eukprot:CAMPEP_0206491372 /NCGR_PEP_ID=MMETSP0324_2-20121206/44946_1 /ASSEMBLY_ACC=CAM_ASM_000836 /TAXON_ID=2866 /ORGANISM="Crypthecodinium cohnii, Strain Seligo" /LENGTH=486 /DNA_ID=CAMNT_0053972529 /DNA_START=127 /DNA_END=1583 /DNA_ORIENTATION=-
MPVDIKAVREAPELFKKSEEQRHRDPSRVQAVLEADADWRSAITKLNSLRSDLGKLQAAIAQKKKSSRGADPCTEELAEKASLEASLSETEARASTLEAHRDGLLASLGNLVNDERVPIAATEAGNRTLRSWHSPRCPPSRQPASKSHAELLYMLDIADFERGVKVAGRRGYFLRGDGVLLNMALQNYGMAFLLQRGYLPVQPPFFMRKEVMARTAELADFDDQLYGVVTKRDAPSLQQTDQSSSSDHTQAAAAAATAAAATSPIPAASSGSYLIATAEQPISAYHQDEVLSESQLPLRYAGVSPCFRAETGSHGLDAKGLFRVHQFEKIEQFVLCKPEDSWKIFEGLLEIVEEFYQSLGLSYRIVAIASGALNITATTKCDLEAWFPASEEYRELVSCSNCTDFQSRALQVRFEGEGGAAASKSTKRFVHMLNATLCATERTLCCLLENYSQETGFEVPSVLLPYMHGRSFLPFIRSSSESLQGA